MRFRTNRPVCRISVVPFLNNITSTDVSTIFKPDGEMFAIQLQTEDHRDCDLIATRVNMIRTQSYFNKMGKSVNGPCTVNNTDWPRSVSWPWSSELLRTLPVNRTSKIFKIDRESSGTCPATTLSQQLVFRVWLVHQLSSLSNVACPT